MRWLKQKTWSKILVTTNHNHFEFFLNILIEVYGIISLKAKPQAGLKPQKSKAFDTKKPKSGTIFNLF